MTNNEKSMVQKPNTDIASLPKDLQDSVGMGVQNIRNEDIRPPRLALAQAMSPQVKKLEAKYIEGLGEGDLFNDLTGDILTNPVEIVVVKFLGVKAIEFAPIESGGGIIDAEVPLTDARCQFRQDPNDPKKRLRPIATLFHEYLIWLPERMEYMTLSMKGTSISAAAVPLNSMLKAALKVDGSIMLSPPSWARTFKLGSAAKKKDAYSWAVFTVKPVGVTPAETREVCKQIYMGFEGKNIVIERDSVEPEGDVDTSFASDM